MNRIQVVMTVLWAAGCGYGGGATADGGNGGSGDGHIDDGNHGGSDGQDQGSDASPQPGNNDLCANATVINIDPATMHTALAATTVGASANLAPPCAAAGVPDVFFKFTLTRRELVYADTFGASANTTLYFASSCTTARTGSTTPGDAVCSSGACGTGQSQVVALLDPGIHYLVFAGVGTATIHFQHAEVGTGAVARLAPGSSVSLGTTAQSGGLNVCEASGGENAYWWQACPSDAGGAFLGSTCAGTAFDTVLSFRMPGTEGLVCNDDDVACPVQNHATLGATIPAGAGLYVLEVDGFSTATYGSYTLSASRP